MVTRRPRGFPRLQVFDVALKVLMESLGVRGGHSINAGSFGLQHVKNAPSLSDEEMMFAAKPNTFKTGSKPRATEPRATGRSRDAAGPRRPAIGKEPCAHAAPGLRADLILHLLRQSHFGDANDRRIA